MTAGSGLRVLVVDDVAPALDEMCQLLREAPGVGSVEAASDSLTALRLIPSTTPDAVFLDISMPGMDGLELAGLLGRMADPPAIVFVTAFIPIVGATAAGILAALVALVANGPVVALIVVLIVVVVNQLEGNFLQPVVMGRSLKLHALVILIALTVGTVLGGIVGDVLSVPIAAVAWGITQVWDGPETPARMFRQKRPEVA